MAWKRDYLNGLLLIQLAVVVHIMDNATNVAIVIILAIFVLKGTTVDQVLHKGVVLADDPLRCLFVLPLSTH